jgi:pyrimidine operon attenuation protein/uracil phosphoribosyltransferase
MKEIGKTIFNMVKVSSSGTTTQGTKVNILKEKNMVMEVILGKMALNIQVFGKKTKSMATEGTLGTMEENIKVTGRTIIWMDMVLTHGKMAGNMKVNTHVTKNMEKVFTRGLMAENMMENGKMAGNTAKVNIFLKRDNSEKEFGIMVKEKNGLTKTKTINDHTIILFKMLNITLDTLK